jgi:hypothetical protein
MATEALCASVPSPLACCVLRPAARVVGRHASGEVDVAIFTVSDCFSSTFDDTFDDKLLAGHLTREEFACVMGEVNSLLQRHGIGRTPVLLKLVSVLLPPVGLACCLLRSCALEEAARQALMEVHGFLTVHVSNVFRYRGIHWSLDFTDERQPDGGMERRWFLRIRLPPTRWLLASGPVDPAAASATTGDVSGADKAAPAAPGTGGDNAQRPPPR